MMHFSCTRAVYRVPNRFGGMRNLTFFVAVIFWILALNRGGKRKSIKTTSGSGISCFYGVGMCESQGKQIGIDDFNSSFTS